MTPYLLFFLVLCVYIYAQELPAPTDNFPYVTSLDRNGSFIIRWNFNDTQIGFEFTANTLGYVGFGISETGHMVQADIFVAYVKEGEVHYGVSKLLIAVLFVYLHADDIIFYCVI